MASPWVLEFVRTMLKSDPLSQNRFPSLTPGDFRSSFQFAAPVIARATARHSRALSLVFFLMEGNVASTAALLLNPTIINCPSYLYMYSGKAFSLSVRESNGLPYLASKSATVFPSCTWHNFSFDAMSSLSMPYCTTSASASPASRLLIAEYASPTCHDVLSSSAGPEGCCHRDSTSPLSNAAIATQPASASVAPFFRERSHSETEVPFSYVTMTSNSPKW